MQLYYLKSGKGRASHVCLEALGIDIGNLDDIETVRERLFEKCGGHVPGFISINRRDVRRCGKYPSLMLETTVDIFGNMEEAYSFGYEKFWLVQKTEKDGKPRFTFGNPAFEEEDDYCGGIVDVFEVCEGIPELENLYK